MILQPSVHTVKRYGLTKRMWNALLRAQGGVCAICRLEPPSGRLTIDHEHVPGWSAMPASVRRLYVRGLLCSWCNRDLGPRWTPDRLRNAAHYLERYDERRPGA